MPHLSALPVTPLSARTAFRPHDLAAKPSAGMLSSVARAFRASLGSQALRRSLAAPTSHQARRSTIPVVSALPKRDGLRPVSARAVSSAPQAATSAKKDEQRLAPTFQQAIQRLQEYWASRGCCLFLPHNTEVGAGTMNPATFLRVLGPEPWNVAYPEPSVRPDDSRYGDNPNRVQRHTQFQVILKPDPGNPQELYLGSLRALGIDTEAHDIRFVEDNWESPVLGAWGLGWEVWLDGMEVTQFTYFQQAGSLVLERPSVEITYGLERIMMALQGVNHFKDIRYNDQVTYGELFLQNEEEMSAYNLDAANLDRHRKRFELFDLEARDMLERRLPIPAYDHVLKLSHAFNVLDARGAVGVTERAKLFGTMRTLARNVSKLWVERREELEYPLGLVSDVERPTPGKVDADAAAAAGARTLVLEIGSEELPPQDVDSGIQQLKKAVPALLEKLRLSHEGVTVEGTPRRLVVTVDGLAASQPDNVERMRGPPANRAFDEDGNPTKAALGFCKKNGIEVADVERAPDPKGTEYLWADVKEVGRPAAVVLAEELPGVVAGLSFGKSMRWTTDVAYSRPLRWILALHGDTVLPFVHGDVLAGRSTRLLRNSPEPVVDVTSAEAYGAALAEAGIVIGIDDRRTGIWEAAQELASSKGGKVPDSARSLLEEVSNLVEAPTPLLGSFDESFLGLPKELLVMVMKKHQRYFHLEDAETGELLPHFITVANGGVDVPTVQGGNEAVLRARYEDAKFFYGNDRAKPLAEFRPSLEGTTFQGELGSMLDKSKRLEALVAPLGKLLGTSDAGLKAAAAAAPLAHSDLVTETVMEFTALAGTMGRHYAQKEGLPEDVSEAVFEFVLPRSAGDVLPSSEAGVLLSAGDRLDSLAGLFAAGCAPTASADPFGLRRAALGLVASLVENDVDVDLAAAVSVAAEGLPVKVDAEAEAAVVAFVTGRLQQYLVDRGVGVEAVRAALAERGGSPALAARTARELGDALSDEAFVSVLSALARPVRLMRGKDVDLAWEVDESLFECEEETALWASYKEVAGKLSGTPTVTEFVAAAGGLVAPIDAFFEEVFVMAEDEGLRKNRLKMLHSLAGLVKGLIDPTELPGF